MPSHKKRNHSRNISRKKKGSKKSQKNVGNKKQFVSLSQFENILFGGSPGLKSVALATVLANRFKKGIIRMKKGNYTVSCKWNHPFNYQYQAKDKFTYSKNFDVWSFGCTMVEMLQYGEPPYEQIHKAKSDAENNKADPAIKVININFFIREIHRFLRKKYSSIDKIKREENKIEENKIEKIKRILEDKNNILEDVTKDPKTYPRCQKLLKGNYLYNQSFFNLMSQSLSKSTDQYKEIIINLIKEIFVYSLYKNIKNDDNAKPFDFQVINDKLSSINNDLSAFTNTKGKFDMNSTPLDIAKHYSEEERTYANTNDIKHDYIPLSSMKGPELQTYIEIKPIEENEGEEKWEDLPLSFLRGGGFPEITIEATGELKYGPDQEILLMAEEFKLLFDKKQIGIKSEDYRNLKKGLVKLYNENINNINDKQNTTLLLYPILKSESKYEERNFRLTKDETLGDDEKVGIILILAALYNGIKFNKGEFDYNFSLKKGQQYESSDDLTINFLLFKYGLLFLTGITQRKQIDFLKILE